jgi:hypothetical protein
MSEEQLRAALLNQWEYNHFEHCSRLNDDGTCHNVDRCNWALPVELGGDPDKGYRPYDR